MLALRMANYVSGAVRIRIYGAVPEKFINLCLTRSIFLWGVSRVDDVLIAHVRLPDFFRVRPLARLSHTRLEVAGYYGWPFVLKRVKRRRMLLVGAVLFLFLLQLLTSYVWFVDVCGQKTVSAEEVRAAAAEYGLRPGIVKDRIDVRAVESGVLLTLPRLAWVGIKITGTRALVEVVEKTLPKLEDRSPADVVASRDGVITEIIVIAGQPAVKKGDTVKKGDVLIRGVAEETRETADGAPEVVSSRPVRASGIVQARVWYEGYGEAPLEAVFWQRTGRHVTGVSVRVGKRVFVLQQTPVKPFDCFDTEVIDKKTPNWRNSDFVVEFTINIFHEVIAKKQPLSPDEARDIAKANAQKAVAEMIPGDAQVLSRSSEILQPLAPGPVRVRVMVETIEDIGQTINSAE